MLRRVAVLLVLCACGGSVASTPSSSSASSSSSGGSSSSGSTSSSSGGDGCSVQIFPTNRACVPGTAKANAPITLDIDATEGCLSCFTTIQPCKVAVGGNTIILTMETKTCKPPGDVGCPAVCAIAETKCAIPPLAAGTYSVVVAGESPRTGLPPRELVVDAAGTESSCDLLQSHQPPPTQDGTKYSTSCSVDADCAGVTFGNPCQPCACPTAAIATTSVPAYQADRRALTSQCPSTDDPIACAACAPPPVSCDTSTGLTGTCRFDVR